MDLHRQDRNLHDRSIKELRMRFIVFVKASNESESGAMPKKQDLAEMNKFNQELVNAGIMLAGSA